MWFANNRTTVYCRCPFTHSVRPTVHTIEPIVNYTYETVAGRRSRNENKCFLSGLPNHRERSSSLWKWRCLRYSCNKSKGLVTSTMYWCTRVHEFWKKTYEKYQHPCVQQHVSMPMHGTVARRVPTHNNRRQIICYNTIYVLFFKWLFRVTSRVIR